MRIAIVNDVMTAAEALRRIVVSVPSYQLAWIARDGAEAVEKCRIDTPDLVLMDMIMPVMDGVEATRQIMAHSPCAILLVTATMEEQFTKIFEALGAGALDVTQTPAVGENGNLEGVAGLKLKIEAMRRIILNKSHSVRVPAQDESDDSSKSLCPSLIAIGASAGGPAAVATILGDLPKSFPGAIVIVQHIDAEFIPQMVSWLSERSAIPVRTAQQGDRPLANTALIAGRNEHLVFTNSRSLGYTTEPRSSVHRPSIDVLFESVTRYWRDRAAGVLLTGMGHDGAAGLKHMRDAGFETISQDSATSVVYGMPKAAAELNAAMKILPLSKIAAALNDLVMQSNPMTQK